MSDKIDEKAKGVDLTFQLLSQSGVGFREEGFCLKRRVKGFPLFILLLLEGFDLLLGVFQLAGRLFGSSPLPHQAAGDCRLDCSVSA